MKQFFLTVTGADSEDQGDIYATLHDASLLPDGCQDLEYLEGKLAENGIVVPEEMLANVEQDSYADDGGTVRTYN